jgi:hypothetical protein
MNETEADRVAERLQRINQQLAALMEQVASADADTAVYGSDGLTSEERDARFAAEIVTTEGAARNGYSEAAAWAFAVDENGQPV